MAEVVGIRGEIGPYTAGEPRPEVVAVLREWLEKAEAGEIVGVAIAALYLDQSTGRSRAGTNTAALIGEIFVLAQKAAQ